MSKVRTRTQAEVLIARAHETRSVLSNIERDALSRVQRYRWMITIDANTGSLYQLVKPDVGSLDIMNWVWEKIKIGADIITDVEDVLSDIEVDPFIRYFGKRFVEGGRIRFDGTNYIYEWFVPSENKYIELSDGDVRIANLVSKLIISESIHLENEGGSIKLNKLFNNNYSELDIAFNDLANLGLGNVRLSFNPIMGFNLSFGANNYFKIGIDNSVITNLDTHFEASVYVNLEDELVKVVDGKLVSAEGGIDYLKPRVSIAGGTHSLITYDTQGLVVSGEDATTDDIQEGILNLYYKDFRARRALSSGRNIHYDRDTGVISSTASGSDYLSKRVTQDNHGFTLDFVHFDDMLWVKSIATTGETCTTHFAKRINDNEFELISVGELEIDDLLDDTEEPLVDGDYYFLSQTLEGKITGVKPEEGIIQSVLKVNATNTITISIQEPYDINDVGGDSIDLQLTTIGNEGAATLNLETGILNIPIYKTPIQLTTTGNGAATFNSETNVLNIPIYQTSLELTTIGSEGASTFNSSTGALNIPIYQEQLVSGTNIKTINGSSILGRGGLTISGINPGGNNKSFQYNENGILGGYGLYEHGYQIINVTGNRNTFDQGKSTDPKIIIGVVRHDNTSASGGTLAAGPYSIVMGFTNVKSNQSYGKALGEKSFIIGGYNHMGIGASSSKCGILGGENCGIGYSVGGLGNIDMSNTLMINCNTFVPDCTVGKNRITYIGVDSNNNINGAACQASDDYLTITNNIQLLGKNRRVGETYIDFYGGSYHNTYGLLKVDNVEKVRITSDAFRLQTVLQLKDELSTPNTITGYAQIYVDIADGDLKIKFGDGTVKTIVTSS